MKKDTAPFLQPLRNTGEHPIRDILAELFAQYERRFPGISVAVVETPLLRLGMPNLPGRPTTGR